MAIDTASQDQQLAQLKSDWNNLHDIDRAVAVAHIRRSGLSIRNIARALGCSESSLRHLLSVLLAPPDDQHLARQGTISTSELVRRAKAAAQERATQQQYSAQQDVARQAAEAATAICDWLTKEKVYGPDGERIIEDLRRDFADMHLTGRIPPVARPAKDTTLTEIVARCRPREPVDNNTDRLAWHSQWLGRWVFFAFPDPHVRDSALDIALQRQWKR